jgi:fido (protein-threonine AMPylation protein)
MATPSEKLAESLGLLKALQDSNGAAAIKTSDISRTHRERLIENGFLQEVMKGWYIPTKPGEQPGSSTAWYASFWNFCEVYLKDRFNNNWSLSPEQSLLIHTGNWTVPHQLLIKSPNAGNNNTPLPHNTSLFDIRANIPEPVDRQEVNGLVLYSLPASLINISAAFFKSNATDVRTGLLMIRDASEVLPRLLDGGHTVIAGRLAGAFRNIGRDRIADDIINAMQSAGYDARENDPFESRVISFTGRETSPYVGRLKIMWQQMRGLIIERFPEPLGLPKNHEGFLKQVQDVYVTDAYHSLSIEGYKVTPDLIERVRSGTWDPQSDGKDKEHRDALAARGYWQSYQAVVASIKRILNGENPGQVADKDHGTWYRELFAPSIAVGILRPSDLAGYRNGPVYIKNSMHVPLNRDAVRDAMPALFDLLKEEAHPAVRVVLGHFVFVYIHPYMDGNGRTGRFLMNAMLSSGGYPWTVIPVDVRRAYMEALEEASVNQNIVPFTNLLSDLVRKGLEGEPPPRIPS